MAFRRSNPNKTYDEPALYEYAVRALGRRMRTVAELKRLMRTKVGKQDNGMALIERVVERLKEQRYLNDTQYATSYSGFRKDNEKFGRRRVEQDLKVKGVHADVIEKVIGETYEGVDEETLARQYLHRKRLKKPNDQKESARIFRALVRGGFSTRAIIGVLKKWDVEDETLSELEQERLSNEDQIEVDEE